MANKRLPVDFNVQSPPLVVTDPDRAERQAQGIPHNPDYPKHLARFEGDAIGGPREVIEVIDAADEKRQRADGFKTHHELDADQRAAQGPVPAARPKAAIKPRTPIPATAGA